MTIKTRNEAKTAETETETETEAWLDGLDPAVTHAEDVSDLRHVGAALSENTDAKDRLHAAVKAARANGRSWGEIGLILGVSKQAARQRFDKIG
jgi:hypothetical protein